MAAMAAERGGGSTTANNNNNMNISSNNSGGGGGNNGGRSLHNFSLPPCLSWGTQKLLRCSNSTSSLNDVVSQNVPPSSSSAKRPRHSSPQYGGGGGGGIDVVREKLMLDLRSEVDKMRAAFLAPPPPPPPRWNLRTRRAVCDDRSSPAAAVEKEEVAKTSAAAVTVAEERGDGGGVSVAAAPRAKFSVALTRQEVEEDFVAMVGRRPPRKPKKRPRYIHKELETIFPGVWLSEVTADMYKVNETPEAPK